MSGDMNGLIIEEGEGPRARALKEALNQATNRVLEGWKVSLFTKCFPTLAKENEEVLKTLRESVRKAVEAAIYEDLSAILTEEDIVKSLEELSIVVKNNSGSKDKAAWRPPGDPVCHMRAHDAKVLQHEKQKLLESVSAARSTSDSLQQKVKEGRKQCQENQKEIQKRLATINNVAELSGKLQESGFPRTFKDV